MIKPWDPPIDTSATEQRILHLQRPTGDVRVW